jgi:16S rRNA (cytosine1402-N4)-methyltransferase
MHQPVMLEAVVELLQVQGKGCYVDGTLGSGGHAEAVLSRLGEEGRLLGIDRDADALQRCTSGWRSLVRDLSLPGELP